MKNGNCMGTTKLFLETKLIVAGHKVIISIQCRNTLDITGLIEKFVLENTAFSSFKIRTVYERSNSQDHDQWQDRTDSFK